MAPGGALFANLGCVACHTKPDADGEDSHQRVPLRHVKAKWHPAALAEFLKDPAESYRWIRMPHFRLSDTEAKQLASYLLSTGTQEFSAGPEGDSARGLQLMISSNCLSCHAGAPPVNTPTLAATLTSGWSKGCLAPDAAARGKAPDFRFSSAQRAALVAFVASGFDSLKHDVPAEFAARQIKNLRCSACHGSDGRGAPGFPNVTDADWQWGGEPENIELTIREGRTGIMTPWIDVLGLKGVDDVTAHVMTLSGRKAPTGDATAGKTQFETICSACHGVDGRGTHALGAPNLTDNIWLHGGSAEKIRETIVKGRQGMMPAQGERMGEARVRLLAAYVLSMGEPSVAQASP